MNELADMISPEKSWEWFVETLTRTQKKAAAEGNMPDRIELIRYWAAANDIQHLISQCLGDEKRIKESENSEKITRLYCRKCDKVVAVSIDGSLDEPMTTWYLCNQGHSISMNSTDV